MSHERILGDYKELRRTMYTDLPGLKAMRDEATLEVNKATDELNRIIRILSPADSNTDEQAAQAEALALEAVIKQLDARKKEAILNLIISVREADPNVRRIV